MIARILLLLAFVWLVLFLLRNSRNGGRPPANMEKTDDMVQCKQCGVHLPRSESVSRDGQTYCCSEHRDAQR